jgi:hypothetical protein
MLRGGISKALFLNVIYVVIGGWQWELFHDLPHPGLLPKEKGSRPPAT